MNAAQTTVGKFLIFFPICFPHFFRYCPSAWSLRSIGRRRCRRHGRKAVEKTAFLLFLIFQFVLPSWSVQSIGLYEIQKNKIPSCAFATISHEGNLLHLSMLPLLIIESLKRKCPKVSDWRGIVYALQDNWQITSKHGIGILADCGTLQNMRRD